MMRAALALAVVAAGPAWAQDGGPIRTGEHADFTRVVMVIDPRTEWSLETRPGAAVIFFPGRRLAFGVDEVFDRIPRTRVTAVSATVSDDGTRVTVGLGCDCRISASFVNARHLALDVGDRTGRSLAVTPAPAEPAEDPAARALREADAVASAEAALTAQITRAADQGIVLLAPQAEPVAPAAPAPVAPPPARPAAAPAPAEPPAALAGLGGVEQIEAISVYDRDSAALAAARPAPPPPEVCLDDAALDIGAWTNGAALHAQTPALMRRVVGEFDRPDPEALGDLVRLHLRFAFGAEAESLLAAFDVDLADRALLADLARAVEGRAVALGGPLAVDEPCPSRHGLWLAAGGAAPVFHDEVHFATVQAAFADLPVDLRALVGPRLANRLIDAGRPEAAALIHLTAVRPGQAAGPELARVAARLAAAEGRTDEAVAGLRALSESGGPDAPEALSDLARLALDAGLALPEPLATDLSAAALAHRGDPREVRLRGLLIETLAARGALPAAIAEARAAAADLPAAAPSFAALAAAALAAADPERIGASVYAATVLDAADLLPRGPAGDKARRAVAGRLVAIGLPNAALDLLAPAVLRGDGASLRLAARAYLALGEAEAAGAVLGTLDDPDAVRLRAEARARAGAPAEAVAILAAAGAEAEAGPYAWPSGDWARARTAAADDPARAAMAGFMATQAGAAPPASAASGPEGAFERPLPPLDAPSLGSARDLIAAGRDVEGFLQTVLAPDPLPAE